MKTETFENLLKLSNAELKEKIKSITPISLEVLNSLKKLEVNKGFRKPKLGFYDHTIHIIGGGQKYGLSILDLLKDYFEITIIANKKVGLNDFKEWYGFDFKNIEIKVIDLEFFKDDFNLDPNKVMEGDDNPFEKISYESMNYDIFINNSMNEMVYSFSPVSILICHFPERRPDRYFYVDKYDYVVYNSKYTSEWIKNKWSIEPKIHIYPPVDMVPEKKTEKEKIILSVARFEVGGSKRQLEMINAFKKMKKIYPEKMRDWRFVLIGGSGKENPYLEKIKQVSGVSDDIEIHVNISLRELRDYYMRSKIFWHMCGLNNNDPSLIEHFGMSIVEAMQNGLVPIVYDGGGQREIVENNISGFRVKSQFELIMKTILLIDDEVMNKKMSENSINRGKDFSIDVFNSRVRKFFINILKNDFKINDAEERL